MKSILSIRRCGPECLQHRRWCGSHSGLLVVALALLALTQPAGAQTQPAAAQTQPAEMPRPELVAAYRAELGDRFDEAKFDQYLAVHRIIERFFAERDSAQRARIIEELKASGIDPVIIGRLCRLRLHWPELPPGVYYINERVGPHTVAYFMGVPPGYDRSKPWPLVVRLPRADALLGPPPPDQPAVGKIYTDWITADLQQHPDAIILMPLLNFDHLFGPGYRGMNSVMQPIFHAANCVSIDPARVYLIGHAAGGHAAWNLGLHYPTYFAAINPMAGAASGEFQRLRLKNLRNTWPVVWHDADDAVIKVNHARQLTRALKAQKIDVDYEETKDLGHSPPQQIVEKLYAKVRSRTRQLYPKEVILQSNRLDPIFNRVDWLRIDQPTRPGDDQRMHVSRGTEKFILQANPWSARAAIPRANFIELKTDNVELMRIYLNDQMVDFDRAVSISINGKVRFEGKIPQDIGAMMNDQLFLGRGWRYFTAAVPIDLGGPATRPTTRPAGKN